MEWGVARGGELVGGCRLSARTARVALRRGLSETATHDASNQGPLTGSSSSRLLASWRCDEARALVYRLPDPLVALRRGKGRP